MSDPVKGLIKEDTDIGTLRRTAMRKGVRTLRLSGVQKVAAGETTIDEVLRVASFSATE